MSNLVQFTEYLGFFGIILAFVATIFSVVAILKARKIQTELDVLFSKTGVADLEKILTNHTKELSDLDGEIQELFEISNKIHSLTQRTIHKVGIIRFNPFKDIGGDQSFALALLDGKDSGIVISSLHTREGTRIYSKPIIKGQSEKYSLTDEEKAAIKAATTIKPSKI